jgi:hypothetical protein
MSVKTILQVELVKPSGGAFIADRVTLTAAGSAVSQTSAPYLFELTAAGAASVLVEKKGHHSYKFALSVVESGSDFTVNVDKKQMTDMPRMLTLLKLGAIGKGTSPGRNQMTLTIAPAKEILLVTGFDYPSSHGPGGMQFHLLATRRMHSLRGSIDDSTVITWFDCKSGLRTRWVMGRATEKTAASPKMWRSGWSLLSSDGVAPSSLSPADADYPGTGVNGIADVYEYIECVGKERPGTLAEFSIMSHSWFGGPILFNTGERHEFAAGAKYPERDPKDKDARFWKDFQTKNMPDKAAVAAAFSAKPFVRIWGCLATTSSLVTIRRADRAKNDTDALGVAPEDRTLWFDGVTVFDDNRPGLIKFIKQSLLKANYMAALATAIGKTVEGGAPGMGALFTPLNSMGIEMFVARDSVSTKNGKIFGFKREMEFLEKQVGVIITKDGYVQYKP